MARVSEFEAIALLRSKLDSQATGFSLGNGDDAAVLRPSSSALVWSIDDSVEGRHFRLAWMTLRQIARRAIHAAASDLAAMGATGLGALVSLQLPARFQRSEIRQLGLGQADASAELGLPIVGGNLVGGSALRLTTTVLGHCPRPWTRDGARPGARVWLFGELGVAACGLRILAKNLEPPRGLGRAYRECVAGFCSPSAKLTAVSRCTAYRVEAAIDVSDGLSADLSHLARAASVAVHLDADGLMQATPRCVQAVSAHWGLAPLEMPLGGGEDYGLVVISPDDLSSAGARPLGTVRTDRPPGVYLEGRSVERGFSHR